MYSYLIILIFFDHRFFFQNAAAKSTTIQQQKKKKKQKNKRFTNNKRTAMVAVGKVRETDFKIVFIIFFFVCLCLSFVANLFLNKRL